MSSSTTTLFNADILNECARLKQELEESRREVEKLSAEKEDLQSKLDKTSKSLSYYQERFTLLVKEIYGKSSEKRSFEDSLTQYLPGFENLASEPKPKEKSVVKGHERTKAPASRGTSMSRDSRFPEHIRRVQVLLEQEEEICPCCGEQMSHVIKELKTEKLCCSRDPFYVKEYVRKVYSCRSCETVAPLQPVPEVFERSTVEESFVAYLAINKFSYSLPLYRQAAILSDAGIVLSRDTLINLILLTSALLKPVYDAIMESVIASAVLFADDTRFQAAVGKLDGTKEFKRGCLWALLGDRNEVAYRFSRSRTHAACREALQGFKGYLTVDGYDGFEAVARAVPEIHLVHCNVHARRTLVRAETSDPLRAREGLEFYGALYQVEKLTEGKEPEEKVKLRQELAAPVWDKFKVWLETTQREVRKNTPIRRASDYILSRWKSLTLYLTDGRLSMDTNLLEQQIRVIAIGRKNYLHAASEVGAQAAAVMYTIVNTCLLQEVDPFLYISDVLRRIGDHPKSQIQELLPRNWKGLYLEEAKKLYGEGPKLE